MSIKILISIFSGIIAGYLFVPDYFALHIQTIIMIGLSFILFSVGVDLGFEKDIFIKFKKLGFKILLFPIFAILGTLFGSGMLSLFTDIPLNESLAIGGGLGWSTLAPVLVMGHSVKLSVIVFLSNILREIIGILLVPIVSKKLGYIEASALPGASSMDVTLPIIERACSLEGAVYGILMGAVMTIVAPSIIPIFLSM